MLYLAVLVFLPVFATAAPCDWSQCNPHSDYERVNFTTCDLVTNPPVQGALNNLSVSGIPNLHVPLETGSYHVRIWNGVDVKPFSDISGLLPGPLFLNTTYAEMDLTLLTVCQPGRTASTDYTASIFGFDQAGASVFCFNLHWTIANCPS
eukprot:m.9330 g.9330  ORF g.9330 m.9330 type:complete len:150 (-) comp7172_c0_seq1:105-554(-)